MVHGSAPEVALSLLSELDRPLGPQERPPRVLVVDDDRHMLSLLVAVLRDAGFVVVTSLGASQVVSMFEEEPSELDDFDLVLTDQHMGHMTGTELSAWLTERDGPPVLLMSGHLDLDLHALATDAGVSEVLVKPFPMGTLLQRIRCLTS
jgi:DNA-binding response OmpR family regulator